MSARILVIDDSPTISHTVEWLLAHNGYAVLVANDGLSALHSVQSFNPELILLDIRLPHVDGYQICELIRGKSEFAKVPIVMLSGLSKECDMERAMEAGADAYLAKPVDDEQLLTVVANHLVPMQ